VNHRLSAVVLTVAALALPAVAGCDAPSQSRAAAVEDKPSIPQLVHQPGGGELLELRPAQVPGMTVAEVREAPLPGVLEANGQVSFDDRRVASIISRVNGRIEDVRVSQWDSVRRGEPIVMLYSPDFMTAEAEYLQAQSTTRISPAPDVGDQGELAQSMLSAARRKLELLGLEDADVRAIKTPGTSVWMRAPISGTVVEKKALRGAQVAPGDVLFSLATLDNVWIMASIYEDDLARVRVGQQMEAVTTSFPDRVFKGTISRISPQVDAATHTLSIRCAVPNPGLVLKPEMLARVRIVTQPGAALVVPQESLVFDTDGYYAFVIEGEQGVTRRRVTIGSWNEHGYARVIEGLKAGERVVRGESIQVNALWREAHGESS
jgi:Cu(I)/Ag(I) efflux system membrane fusion protein